jgi:hypothetical protein
VRGHDDQVTAFRPCGIDDRLTASAARATIFSARFCTPARQRGCVEVVIVTNENSTIDPTYDVNDASDGP